MKAPSFRSDNYGPGAALGCRRAQGRPTVNLLWGFLVTAGVAALAITVMLLVSLDRPFCDAEGKAS